MCCRSLCTMDDDGTLKRVGGDADAPSLLSFLSNHCRKRNYIEERESQDSLRPRKRFSKSHASCTDLIDSNITSGRFREAGMAAVPPETSSKKRQREDAMLHTTGHVQKETGKSDEDLTNFNTFQYWRVPLPDLDMSLLHTDPSSSEPMATQNARNTESMET